MSQGRVYKSTGSWYIIKVDQTFYKGRTAGKLRLDGSLATNPIAVGDFVELSFNKDGTVQITEVLERDNFLIRKAAGKTEQYQIVAANIDQAILVQSFREPKYKRGLIDRFLLTCEAYDVSPVLLINKIDLCDDEAELAALCEVYTSIGYQVMTCSLHHPAELEQLRQRLAEQCTLIFGQSGAGKSSLISHFLPEKELRTSEVSSFNSKGMHTTTFAEMFDLPFGGTVIDTPGIREFGLVGFEPHELGWYMPEMVPYKQACKFTECRCDLEEECEVKRAVEQGSINKDRYLSYLHMLDSLSE